jgi:hypothetical protein
MSTDPNELPKEIEEAVRRAICEDMPGRSVSKVHVCAEEDLRLVVRVYLPVPDLKPTPYAVYAVDRTTFGAKRLTGRDSEPYEIANYK